MQSHVIVLGTTDTTYTFYGRKINKHNDKKTRVRTKKKVEERRKLSFLEKSRSGFGDKPHTNSKQVAARHDHSPKTCQGSILPENGLCASFCLTLLVTLSSRTPCFRCPSLVVPLCRTTWSETVAYTSKICDSTLLRIYASHGRRLWCSLVARAIYCFPTTYS